MYRAFRPFTGDVLKAEQFFLACAKGGDAEARLAATEWLDSERAKLEPSEAGRPSKRRCIECNQLECICPGLDDPARYDMYGGGSADCGAMQDHVAGRTARFGVCRETGRARTESQNTS